MIQINPSTLYWMFPFCVIWMCEVQSSYWTLETTVAGKKDERKKIFPTTTFISFISVFDHLRYQFQHRRMSWQLGWGRVCGMIDSFKYPLRGVKVSGSCWIKVCVCVGGGELGACGRDDEVQTNQVSMTVHYNMTNKQTHHVAHIQCMRVYQQETLILIPPPPLTCITLTLFNIINSII